jgi:hypothetical protein
VLAEYRIRRASCSTRQPHRDRQEATHVATQLFQALG